MLLPPELHDWCDWVYDQGKAGNVLRFRAGEAGFMDAAGGALCELITAFERGDPVYDVWRSHVRHVVELQKAHDPEIERAVDLGGAGGGVSSHEIRRRS